MAGYGPLQQIGHKQNECPQLQQRPNEGEFVFSASTDTEKNAWLLDGGASSHMTYTMNDFCEYKNLRDAIEISVANGHRLLARGVGTVRFHVGGGRPVKITGVLYVPGPDRKLLSIPALVCKGVSVAFGDDGRAITFDGERLALVPKVGKLYAWSIGSDVVMRRPEMAATVAEKSEDAVLWHARLGHVLQARMQAVSQAVDGVPVIPLSQDGGLCDGCAFGKMTVSPFARQSGSTVKTHGLLDIIHSDVMGPMQTTTEGGARYVVTFVDDNSRFVNAYLLSSKSDVSQRFTEYRQLMETQTQRSIKCIRSDNGGEYLSKRSQNYCAKNGIIHQTSAPYSPQQNGLAERMNRTIVDMARSMLHYMQLGKCWWGEAVVMAAYIINRIPNTARPHSTPFELFFGSKLRLDHLCMFGARGFAHVDQSKRTKWDPKAHRCIFLGYADASKAYHVWGIDDVRLVVSRTVILDERPPSPYCTVVDASDTCLPRNIDCDECGSKPTPSSPTDAMEMEVDTTDDSPDTEPMDIDNDNPVLLPPPRQDAVVVASSVPQTLRETRVESPFRGSDIGLPANPQRSIGNGSYPRSLTVHARELVPLCAPVENQLVFRNVRSHPLRSERMDPTQRFLTDALPTERTDRLLPAPADPSSEQRDQSYLAPGFRDLIDTSEVLALPPSISASDSDTDEPEAKRQRVGDDHEIALAATEAPSTYAEAMTSPSAAKWKDAIRADIRSHVQNHTWDLVRQPPGAKVIGCERVFAIKRGEHGNIVRYKARLVALGFLQTYGVDYTETYPPVVSLNTVRVFLAVRCSRDCAIKQYDVETAFLNVDLEETVQMTPPTGTKVPSGLVCCSGP